MAYSVQRISCDLVDSGDSIEQALDRPQTGSRNVFSRLKTRAMKTPSGLVTSEDQAKKNRICNQPLTVISEFLRTQQCVKQIHANVKALMPA